MGGSSVGGSHIAVVPPGLLARATRPVRGGTCSPERGRRDNGHLGSFVGRNSPSMPVDHGRVVGNATRAVIISNRRITGLTAGVIAELVGEIGPLWHERHQARLASRPRRRALGAGAKHRLVFVDRLLATLVHLRHGVTHDMLACWFGADRSTITRAVGPWPRSSTTSARAGRPASSTEPRAGSAGPPLDARTGTSSSLARTSRTPSNPWWSRTAKAACCGASPARPVPQAARTSPTPASQGWSSSWPTGLPSRSWLMPATRDLAPRPVAGW